MSTTKGKAAILSGAIATLGLFTVVVSSASAAEQNQTPTKVTAADKMSESITQKPMNQPAVRQKSTMQPANEGGCSCCKNMMGGNMSGMMNHNKKDMMQSMPGMMRMPSTAK
ncbi:hypothetical protein [Trichocoleus sp. FACHB-262]|uniref:hypothetical protein n=1 Tax=Trichocoleus sp. FACHB-262 TaxID=2692869 RepID=UPI001682B447|nr:hypothetical protein [Trichocoleus sp. FACHB-262]MBD2123146.1 hypothetical protein [Trichocoleus sp. FACHB-262]